MNDQINNLSNLYESSNFNLSYELSNDSYDVIRNNIYNLHMNIMNNLNEELSNILDYHNYLIENLGRRLFRLSENINNTNPSLDNLNSQIYVLNELRNQVLRLSDNLNNDNDNNFNNRLTTDNTYILETLYNHVENDLNNLHSLTMSSWYDNLIRESYNNERHDNDSKETNLNVVNKFDEDDTNKENNFVHEGKCPICGDVKNLESKFKCKHSVCIECFHGQLGSNVNLVCCICRSEVDNKKLRKKEKKMIDDRSNIEAPGLSSSFGLLNLVAFGSVHYSFDDDES